MEGSTQSSQSELRKLDITELAESSRESWMAVKNKIDPDVLAEIGPKFDVLTDPNYVKQFAEAGSHRT